MPVPKGTSRVEFNYEPRAFPLGIALAVAGLIEFIGVWCCRSGAGEADGAGKRGQYVVYRRTADP